MKNLNSRNDCRSGWESLLSDRLQSFGHRNWIGIVDSAYPEQTAPGVDMVPTGEDHLRIIKKVLGAISAAPHVRANVYLDAELLHLDEASAQGVDFFKTQLDRLLEGQEVVQQPHEAIIELLDQAGQQFSVLLVKSNLAIPYTSVFLRLECGYWDDDAEKALRQAMKKRLAHSEQEGK